MKHDAEAELTLTLEQVIKAGEVTLSLNNQTIKARLPKGITDGTQIKLPGKAQGGGDILLTIHVAPHKDFTIEGADLTRDVHVPVWDAVLGKDIHLSLIHI